MSKNRKHVRVGLIFLAMYITTFSLVFYLASGAKSALIDSQLGNRQSFLAQIASAIEQNVRDTQFVLEVLSQEAPVVSGSPDRCSAYLKQQIANYDTIFDTFSRTNADGVFDCSTVDTARGLDGLSEGFEYLQQIFSDPGHNPVLARAQFFGMGEIDLALALHVPIFEGNQFKGTLGSALKLDVLDLEVLQSGLFRDSSFTIIDDDATILYQPDFEVETKSLYMPGVLDNTFREAAINFVAQPQLVARIIEMDGRNFISSAVSVFPGRVWTMVAEFSDEQLLESSTVGNPSARLATAGWLGIGFAALFVTLAQASIVAAIVSLTKHTRKTPVKH